MLFSLYTNIKTLVVVVVVAVNMWITLCTEVISMGLLVDKMLITVHKKNELLTLLTVRKKSKKLSTVFEAYPQEEVDYSFNSVMIPSTSALSL